MQTLLENKGPKLLVCHDMQGGYGDDSFLDGGTDPEQYFLTHWHIIDTFVYFSHHSITIPPPGWTDCSHRHGTKVGLTSIIDTQLSVDLDIKVSNPLTAISILKDLNSL